MTKNWKKFTAENFSKIAIYLILGLHKGRPSYRRSLQPSKENIQHFKTFFLFLWVIFAFLDLIESRSNPDPDPIHCI
jgi:hypothetical protein